MFDGNLVLQAPVTKTGSFSGTGLNLLTTPPTPRRGLKAKIFYSAASNNMTGVATTAASNASPISVTATGHGFATGDVVSITGVTGNTNANGTFVITKVDANTFTLNGSSGNAAYVSGGTAYCGARATFNIDQSPDNTNWFPLAYSLQNGVGGLGLGPPAGPGTGYYTDPAGNKDLIFQGIYLPNLANTGLAAAGGELDIPFDALYPYVRLTLGIAGSGTAPTITYNGLISLGWP